jgi:hypothetical protein
MSVTYQSLLSHYRRFQLTIPAVTPNCFTSVRMSNFVSVMILTVLAVHLSLSPYIGAIDGLGQSALIKDCWLPWMASSPLMAYTAILSSSLYQAEARGLDVSKFPEAIAIRVKIILMVNEYLKTNAKAVSDEAISAVMHLLVNEVWVIPFQLVLGIVRPEPYL